VSASEPARVPPDGGVVVLLADPPFAATTRTRAAQLAGDGWFTHTVQGPFRADAEALAALVAARRTVGRSGPHVAVGIGPEAGLASRLAGSASVGWSAVVEVHGRILHGTLDAGRPAQPLDLFTGLGCPWLGHFAEADAEVPHSHVAALAEKLSGLPASTLLFTYPGLDAAGVAEDACAWARTRTFLRHIRAAAG
jgi:dienelactone hydrolase